MHDILSMQSIHLDEESGDIIVKAILAEVTYVPGSQTHWSPPEYAPCLCQTIIYKDSVPPGVELKDNEEDLEEVINRYNLLSNQDWLTIIEDNSDADLDEPYIGGRLFF
jgi:hypothetical protein